MAATVHIKEIKMLPYSPTVRVVLCSSIDAARKQIGLQPHSKKNWDTNCIGYSFIDTSKNELKQKRFQPYLFLNVEKYTDFADFCDTAAHELIHTIDKVFEFSSIDTDYNNNEPYAYMMGYLMGELIRFYFEVQSAEFCTKEGYITKYNEERGV